MRIDIWLILPRHAHCYGAESIALGGGGDRNGDVRVCCRERVRAVSGRCHQKRCSAAPPGGHCDANQRVASALVTLPLIVFALASGPAFASVQ